MGKEAFLAYISGIVQGVGYRYFTYRKANEYGLTGYVKNLPDGRVEVFAEGEKVLLEQFLSDLKSGPQFAMVEDVSIKWQPYQNKYDKFYIESSYGF